MVMEPHVGMYSRDRREGSWLSYVPLLLLIVFLYAGLYALGVDFTASLFSVNMPSGGAWSLTVADTVTTLALFILFVEILKSTRTGGNSVYDHALSLIVFVLCLVLFLVWDAAATSLFFIITMIALIDVVAGFSVTIRAARRDYAFGGES